MADDRNRTSFQREILGLVEDSMRGHPGAKVDVKVELGMPHGDFVTVVPQSPAAATIYLHFYSDGGFVDFSFGALCSPFELDGVDYLDRLRELCQAVIEGRCGETRGFIARKSWLELPQGRVGSSSFFYPRLWPRTRRFVSYSA